MIERSADINELAAALSKAQGEIGGAGKDSRNPHFNSSFASLASVRDAFRDPLAKHGLSVVQLPERDGNEVVVYTMLLHASGQFISCRLAAVPVKQDPQGIGSCLSYLRRYSLMSVIGIAPEDDDGNAAREPPSQRPQRRANVPAATQPHPPSTASPSGSPPESDDQVKARWMSALKATTTLAELSTIGKCISEDRVLGDDVRLELSKFYKEHQVALKQKDKAKPAPGPCSNCGDKEHAGINCPNASAEERAAMLRADVTKGAA